MTLSEELTWRGFIQQSTYEDITDLDKGQITFYMGFDASADSQTIGNLAAMMMNRIFMRHNHKAIALAGGSTSLIGDPGGKDKERVLQNEDTIAANVAAAQEQLKIVYKGQDFTLVNNLDWTSKLNVLDFLRNIGKHYSMTTLLQRDYIAQRIGEGGSGITYTEFSYTLLQGLDFLHLYDNYGVTLQLGGSDQWGNCLSGVELIRKARGAEVNVITLPLIINQATGKKFGKSEDGAVWLDPKKTSPYAFYQFWLNADDEGAESYLKIYTELDKEAIDNLMAEHNAEPHLRKAQQRLAEEITLLIHGVDELAKVQNITRIIFDKNAEINAEDIKALSSELITVTAGLDDIDFAQVIVDLLLASSKTEANQLLKSGAIKDGAGTKLESNDSLSTAQTIESTIVIRRGKNQLGLLRLN